MTDAVDGRLDTTGQLAGLPGSWGSYWLVMLRLVAGWWLLHAGLSKLLAWPFDASPYVGGAARGTILGPVLAPFSEGVLLTFTNVAVPVGETLVGLGLLVGCLTRVAAVCGGFLLAILYVVNGQSGDWAQGLVTGELLGVLVLGTVAAFGAGRVLGIDAYLGETEFVRNRPVARFLVGPGGPR